MKGAHSPHPVPHGGSTCELHALSRADVPASEAGLRGRLSSLSVPPPQSQAARSPPSFSFSSVLPHIPVHAQANAHQHAHLRSHSHMLTLSRLHRHPRPPLSLPLSWAKSFLP